MKPISTDASPDSQIAAALARCAGGDRGALRLVHDLEGGRMLGVARRMLRRQDLAEEAVQEALVRLWRGARSYDPQKGAPRTWIYAILRNCCLSILRTEGRFEGDEVEAIEDLAGTATVERLPERSALRRCLDRLDSQRRDAVILAHVYGLSHGELAGRLGVPLGTAKSWVRRSLLSLQECMG